MAHDVFISYSTKDKIVAFELCTTLEIRGIRCWIAPRNIPPGIPYPEAIINALNQSRIMVVVFSNAANESDQVMQEVERAVAKKITIIPFRIEDKVPTGSLELMLSARQWLEALRPPMEDHYKKLADSIESLLSNGEEGKTPVAELKDSTIAQEQKTLLCICT